MKHYHRICTLFLMVSLWLPSMLSGTDYFLQSRIKGTMMAAGLGDAFARTVLNRADRGYVKPVTTFYDLYNDEWVFDSKDYAIGIATENTVLGIAEFEALVYSRNRNFSIEDLVATSKKSLARILDKKGDPFFPKRRIRQETFDASISAENDPVALVRAVSIGLTFCDHLPTVLYVTNRLIKNSYRNPEVCAACIALAVGIAHLVMGDSVDNSIAAMITAVNTHGQSRHVETSIKQAVKKARKEHSTFIGSRLKATAGQITGDTSEEVLAAAIYCFMKSPGYAKESLRRSVHAQGNNAIIAYITGALSGAYNGFWGLKKQGYTNDLEILEKINVLQGTCNDLYILLTDYPTYTLSESGFWSRQQRLILEGGRNEEALSVSND